MLAESVKEVQLAFFELRSFSQVLQEPAGSRPVWSRVGAG